MLSMCNPLQDQSSAPSNKNKQKPAKNRNHNQILLGKILKFRGLTPGINAGKQRKGVRGTPHSDANSETDRYSQIKQRSEKHGTSSTNHY